MNSKIAVNPIDDEFYEFITYMANALPKETCMLKGGIAYRYLHLNLKNGAKIVFAFDFKLNGRPFTNNYERFIYSTPKKSFNCTFIKDDSIHFENSKAVNTLKEKNIYQAFYFLHVEKKMLKSYDRYRSFRNLNSVSMDTSDKLNKIFKYCYQNDAEKIEALLKGASNNSVIKRAYDILLPFRLYKVSCESLLREIGITDREFYWIYERHLNLVR